MSVSKKSIALCSLALLFCALGFAAETYTTDTLASQSLAKQLGWVDSNSNHCGGYYLDQPFVYPVDVTKKNLVEITSDQTLFSQRSTSVLEGKVTATRQGQQITGNKAYLYRDQDGKLNAIDLIGDVNLREPNTLVVGKQGHYSLVDDSKTLQDILYRTTLNNGQVVGPKVPFEETTHVRKINNLTAWGRAHEFTQSKPLIYELSRTSFSTCPPEHPTWQLKASHIVLNKNTGRGYATHARVYVKNIPVVYFPYINFSIDGQRKSGFLWPEIGTSNKWGPYLLTPVYWNIAPNYDMTFTPGYLAKNSFQFSDTFRYLSTTSSGALNANIVPDDRKFASFKEQMLGTYRTSTDPETLAELTHLLNSSNARKGFSWRDDSQFNPNWSSHLDFNYASDDYYMRDFGSNLNSITKNYLLQEGDLYYKSEHWNFTGRMQAYQSLHPVDETTVQNQYRRLPQLILSGDYPDQPLGLEYFITNEITHFTIINNPGEEADSPVGNRLHMQPGVSLPLYTPYFYFNPRVQVALTDYNLYQTADSITPNDIHRSIPIFDLASGLMFDRDLNLFHHAYQQTLEPQIYYTYIPYHYQGNIPIFDTTVNTLTYDQIFNYNRFTGIDRIGDANQVGVGVTSRFLNKETGDEKIRVGVGDIIYFANRLVTLCNTAGECTDNPDNHSNFQRLSPISGFFNYSVNSSWSLNTNALWDPISKQLNNSTISLHYQPDEIRIINLAYSYAKNGNVFSGISNVNADGNNNLKLTDISFSWPVTHDVSAVGRWSQDWKTNHFQNFLYGLQYDTCCWAVRFVGGRAFTNLSPNQTPQYNKEFYIQFALKGLGNIGNGNPTGLLNTISGYKTQFGQDF